MRLINGSVAKILPLPLVIVVSGSLLFTHLPLLLLLLLLVSLLLEADEKSLLLLLFVIRFLVSDVMRRS